MKWLIFLLGAALGCSRPTGTEPSADAAPAAPLAHSSLGTPVASATGATEAGTPAGLISYAGTYTSKPGSLSVPDGGEWAGVTFRGGDASVGLGDGTLVMAIDAKTGRAEGTSEGSMGALVLSGILRDGILSFTLVPKDRAEGLTGSAMGKLASATEGTFEGTMNLSLATANVLRAASFTLARKKAGAP